MKYPFLIAFAREITLMISDAKLDVPWVLSTKVAAICLFIVYGT